MVQQRLPTWPKNIPQLHIYIAWIILGIVFLGVGSKVLQDAHHVSGIMLLFFYFLISHSSDL